MSLQLAEVCALVIKVLLDAKQVSRCRHQRPHIPRTSGSRQHLRLVIAERVVLQALHLFTSWCSIAVDDPLISLVGHLLADVIFIIRHQDTLAMTTWLFGIQLHRGMKGCS